MRPFVFASIAAAMLISTPAVARQTDKPITDRNPDAVDIAKTPVTDLNISKEQIPQLLIDAQREPYTLTGLRGCNQLIAEVEQFDALLGPDLDLPQAESERMNAGRIAQTVVGSFIPFRGLIREVSGANEHRARVEAAIQAGLVRRAYLKGVGQLRDCSYPARPAPDDVIAARRAELAAAKAKDEDEEQTEEDGVRYTSQPVIQEID